MPPKTQLTQGEEEKKKLQAERQKLKRQQETPDQREQRLKKIGIGTMKKKGIM